MLSKFSQDVYLQAKYDRSTPFVFLDMTFLFFLENFQKLNSKKLTCQYLSLSTVWWADVRLLPADVDVAYHPNIVAQFF